MRPPLPSMMLSRRAKILLAVVAILIVLLILLVKLSGVYINYLWFDSLGHRNVYSTVLWTKVSLFFIFGALMAVILGANMVVAYLVRPPFRPMSPEQQNLQNYVLMVEPRRKLILAGVMIIAFLAAGASAQGDWAAWQLWLHGGSFHITDPQFHRDISFYAWDYPVYRILLGFGFTAVIFSLLLALVIHYLSGAIRLQTPGPKVTIAARRQLTVLVFVFMILKAIAYWLDRYGLVFSSRSKFTGASYTDVHSLLPAKTILFWITIILAIGVLASMWTRSALVPGIGFVALLVISIIISVIYPAIVQNVSVNPNASTKEAPYIKRNIEATRAAYDIDTEGGAHPNGTVHYVQYPAVSNPLTSAVTGEETNQNSTVSNIRILDPNVISPTFTNVQKIGLPYGFSDPLDVDRYTLRNSSGQDVTHDYIVGVREQAPGSNLQGSQNNWINQHTVYTHGYGFVAAQADKDVTNVNDTSAYTEGDIPPKGPLGQKSCPTCAAKLTQPDVYYGQLGNNYSIVGAKGTKREYDANSGKNVSYQGKGGVSLSSLFTRLAFAVNYKDTHFLLNDTVSAPGAKIIFNRNPRTIVQKVAPFLTVDRDAYPVVDPTTGHIVWILDAYTTMANYPYSQRQSLSDLTHTSLRQGQKDTQINYIRNSVKATVDAYDGTVHLYAWDQSDPVLRAWMSVFPGLVQPKSAMPSELVPHIRYPQDLFDVQRSLLAQYHITNPVAWYNGKGKWAVPSDPFAPSAGDQPPYYVLADPPTTATSGSHTKTGQPQFQLTSPMVVSNANNLAAYLSVDSDPGPDYGKITALEVPKKSVIQGPSQIANVFKSDPTISRDINLLNQSQSEIIHGNLLTLPLGDSFMYVEPLYVQATTRGSYPTLRRILVTYGDHIGYGNTLANALKDITVPGRQTGESIIEGETGSSPTTTPTPTPSGSTAPSTSPSTSPSTAPSTGPTTTPPAGSVGKLVDELSTAYQQLNAAYDTHDQTKINDAQAKVNELVAKLAAARSQEHPSPTSGPSS